MKKLVGAALAALLFYCTPASAQIGVEANGTRSEEQWGGELGVGYAVHAGPFSLRPVVGALVYKGDSGPYYMDDNGGSPRCRDSRNGQYAENSDCDATKVKAFGRVEALFNAPGGFSIGGGARISDEVRPYGTIAFGIGPKLKLKGNAGPHYFAGGITFGF